MAAYNLLCLFSAMGCILLTLAACAPFALFLEQWLIRREWYRNLLRGDDRMTVSKRLTAKNGLTIPKHVRGEAGFTPGMAVDIETVADGVLIKKRVPACRFCGSVQGVVNIHGMEMCGDCAAAIRKELENVGA